MKKIIILVIWIAFTGQIKAQNVINPIKNLVKSTYENNMFSYRFFSDYALIKNEIYEKKIMSDIDNTLSRFDNNLSYMTNFVSKDKNSQKHYMNLQLFWNDYRILILDPDNVDYKTMSEKTNEFKKLNEELSNSIIEKNKLDSSLKEQISALNILVNLTNSIDQLLINYLYNNQYPEKDKLYKTDTKSISKQINKLAKTRYGRENKLIINDLNETLSLIESLYSSKNNSKQMYSNTNYFSKKSFILMNRILSTIKK